MEFKFIIAGHVGLLWISLEENNLELMSLQWTLFLPEIVTIGIQQSDFTRGQANWTNVCIVFSIEEIDGKKRDHGISHERKTEIPWSALV